MEQYNIYEAKTRFSELVQRVMLGEEVIIAKDNKPVAKLSPLKTPKTKRRIGTARNLVKIHKDFYDPLADLEEYTL